MTGQANASLQYLILIVRDLLLWKRSYSKVDFQSLLFPSWSHLLQKKKECNSEPKWAWQVWCEKDIQEAVWRQKYEGIVYWTCGGEIKAKSKSPDCMVVILTEKAHKILPLNFGSEHSAFNRASMVACQAIRFNSELVWSERTAN